MKTTIFTTLALIMTIFITSCSQKVENEQSTVQTVCVQADTIKETTAEASIHCSGLLASKRITKLSFKTGGIISKILVEEGSSVKKGQLLASLDMTEIAAQVQQSRIAYEKAERDLKRAKNLYSDTIIALEMLQNASSAYEAALETKNIAEFNMRYSNIVAPANGKIISKLAEENELTAPGMPVLVFSEQGNDEWIVKTGLSDKDMVVLKRGDKATITFDAFQGLEFEAYVDKMAESADQTSGTFEVELSVKPGTANFINGMVANVKINSLKMQTISLVPPDAITEVDGNKGFVYVLDSNNTTAKKVPVTISYMQNNEIAVVESLNKMGKVITKGAAYLEDGSKISLGIVNK